MWISDVNGIYEVKKIHGDYTVVNLIEFEENPKGDDIAMAKRKTHTSSEVKNRYNTKTYDRITVSVKKNIAKRYKEKCDRLSITRSEPIHNAIDQFLRD